MSSNHSTSSITGTLYFGYGSNLSPYQMTARCPSSGTPLGVARLNSWFWIISERGYANVVPVRPTETSLDTDATTVWGVIYNLTPEDEARLDGFEGHSKAHSGSHNLKTKQGLWKPFEQGKSTYNKFYLPVKVEKWLIPDPATVLGLGEAEHSSSIVRALVYVDEQCVLSGRIAPDYVRRMGRSVRECIPLGVPERWLNNILGQHDIIKDDPNSFTDDIKPGQDARPPPRDDWEELRLQYLQDELNQPNVQ